MAKDKAKLSVGEVISIYRKKQELTQQELAQLIEVSVGTVVNYENNKTLPDIETLGKIIKVLHIPVNLLF